jgi:hypothetical protein
MLFLLQIWRARSCTQVIMVHCLSQSIVLTDGVTLERRVDMFDKKELVKLKKTSSSRLYYPWLAVRISHIERTIPLLTGTGNNCHR